MLERIAIINRGEPARRLIHAARELSVEAGRPIRTIALYTEEERHATFVREADEAVLIRSEINPYLDLEQLESALLVSRADAAWVGWGFVAEDPAFPELCERLGVTFIGPAPDVMHRLGDKIGAKLLAEENDVPVAEWSGGPVDTVEDALKHADEIGFPLMIKATAGGGGRGIRRVEKADEVAIAFERARDEALRSFGDATVFMERVVQDARHVEVQVIADAHGNAWALGVRDCSVQRRNQKLIEESASPVLAPEQSKLLADAAVRLVKAAGYRNAGTVEFLYQPAEQKFAFLEVNTRLQVEHPVTEATSGADLVKLQILVASGEPLPGEQPAERGHAIEGRLNTEDPQRGFAPAPGRIVRLRFPSGPGIRVDSGFAEGDEIPSAYDSMIAKIIAWGSDRAEALARLRRALAETSAVIEGGATNRTFLLELLQHPDVIAGTVDTGWLDRLGTDPLLPAHLGDVAVVTAAIEACNEQESLERAEFYASARRGRPADASDIETTVELRFRGAPYRAVVGHLGPGEYRVRIDGADLDVHVDNLGEFDRRVVIGDRIHRVTLSPSASDLLVEVDGLAHRVSRDEGGLIRAPAPALVVAIPVSEGTEVAAGEPVVVVEAMKMETTLTAPFAGTVREVLVAGNVQVAAGAPLVRLEPSGSDDDDDAAVVERVVFTSSSGDDEITRVLDDMRSLVLGYDIDPATARGLIARLDSLLATGDGTDLLARKLEILRIFADLAELSRDRPPVEDADGDEWVHSPRESFNGFLRSLDVKREGLTEALQQSLSRALTHYGVTSLDRSRELIDACYRIFLAHQRVATHLPVVSTVLGHLQNRADGLDDGNRDELRHTLDRLIVATQLRHPAIADEARAVRFAVFDRPELLESRESSYRQFREDIDALAAGADGAAGAEHRARLIDSPFRLLSLLGEQVALGQGRDRILLDVFTHRYYKFRELKGTQISERAGRWFLTATYDRRRQNLAMRDVGLVTTVTTGENVGAALAEIGALIREGSYPDGAVADLYVAWSDPPADLDEIAAHLTDLMRSADLPEALNRVAVSINDTSGGGDRHFTFRRVDGELVEERVARGMHPMIARRLRLWRLDEFALERLPSVGSTYLFRCTADEGGDRRLVAMAEVRDFNLTRDASGAPLALPGVESTLGNCLESIRGARADGSRSKGDEVNHVFLYVWPVVSASMDDLVIVARNRLAQMTAGLGLEDVTLYMRTTDQEGTEAGEIALSFSYQPNAGVTVLVNEAPAKPLAPLTDYDRRKLPARRRGTVYPYELVPLVSGTDGGFTEYDLDENGAFTPVTRGPGGNTAGVVCGVVSTPTEKYPEGMTRVVIMGDPTRSLGSVSEPECSRIIAAIDLAEEMKVPVEWFSLSSGAKISRDSGVENMDWVARALRRIVRFTQDGGEINIIVAGINVGAQPYWNAEATMLMHTRGILIMTPDSAMVLTGKQALDYSGGVSAEDNFGIGGYDRIMGPNGEAQYWAPHLAGACDLLFQYYDRTYVAPGERFARPRTSGDPVDRDVREFPLSAAPGEFQTVGEIFSTETNAERKRPFDIRPVMRAVADLDSEPLERWAGMGDADTAVVFDCHLGGRPVSLIGIESRPIPRTGFLPADGPDQWSAGTLFPASSKKVARAINAASGSRPLVVLANLSGFDGSPESLRKWQLEFGAEIGRGIVNFDGPIVFCVISRYHGGAFVVFSGALNDNMEVVAVEGSYASVIGGAPAAAVVFARDVDKRTNEDPRVQEIEARIAEAPPAGIAALRAELNQVRSAVRSEKLGEVATEFDDIHSIERAQKVGSVDTIVTAANLRSYLIEAVERGVAKFEGGTSGGS